MKPTYEELESQLAALAAENAGLKNALEWLYEAVSMPDSGPIPDKYYSAVTNAAAVMHETPATDDFLAEVRAQGLERLAKAWYAIANETAPGISISESSRLKYRQRADDVADFANEIRKEAAQ